MARSRTNRIEEIVDDPTLQQTVVNENGDQVYLEQEPEEERIIRELLASADLNKGSVSISRRREDLGESDYSYVGNLQIVDQKGDTFLELLKTRYGSGKYRLRFNRANGTYFKGAHVSIINDNPKKEPVPTIAQPQNNTEFLALIQNVQAQSADKSDKMMQMFMLMMSEQQKSQMALLTALLPAMMGKGNGGTSGMTMRDVIELMPMLQQKSSIKELAEGMQMVKQIAAGENPLPMGNEPKEDSMFDSIIKAGLPILAGLAQRHMQPQMQAQIPMEQQAQPPVQQVGLPPTFGYALGKMIKAAQKDSDVETWIDLTFEMLGEQDLDGLEIILKRDDWEKLIFNDPVCSPYYPLYNTDKVKTWFAGYRKLFLEEMIVEDEQPVSESETPIIAQS